MTKHQTYRMHPLVAGAGFGQHSSSPPFWPEHLCLVEEFFFSEARRSLKFRAETLREHVGHPDAVYWAWAFGYLDSAAMFANDAHGVPRLVDNISINPLIVRLAREYELTLVHDSPYAKACWYLWQLGTRSTNPVPWWYLSYYPQDEGGSLDDIAEKTCAGCNEIFGRGSVLFTTQNYARPILESLLMLLTTDVFAAFGAAEVSDWRYSLKPVKIPMGYLFGYFLSDVALSAKEKPLSFDLIERGRLGRLFDVSADTLMNARGALAAMTCLRPHKGSFADFESPCDDDSVVELQHDLYGRQTFKISVSDRGRRGEISKTDLAPLLSASASELTYYKEISAKARPPQMAHREWASWSRMMENPEVRP